MVKFYNALLVISAFLPGMVRGQHEQQGKYKLRSDPRVTRNTQDTTNIVTIYEGTWGTFSGWSLITADYYACGAKMRMEALENCDSDCTAANGLELMFCNINDWNDQVSQVIGAGTWGEWAADFTMCDEGSFIQGGQVNYQDPVNVASDDTALNGLRILCRNEGSDETWVEVESGFFGVWKQQVYHRGSYVKAARIQTEASCGVFCDDTAMNGIEFDVDTLFSTPSPTVSPTVIPAPSPPSDCCERALLRTLRSLVTIQGNK